MTQLGGYATDPLMGPADRLPLIAASTPSRIASSSPQARPLGARLARMPMKTAGTSPQCGQHSKTYTIDRKTENTKIIVDGKEENHQDTTEVEREID